MGILIGITMLFIGLCMDIFAFIQINNDMSGSIFFRYSYQPPFTDHEMNMIITVSIGFILFLIGIITTYISYFSAKRKKELMSTTIIAVKKFSCPKCGVNLSTDCKQCPGCGENVLNKKNVM